MITVLQEHSKINVVYLAYLPAAKPVVQSVQRATEEAINNAFHVLVENFYSIQLAGMNVAIPSQ
jgi:mannitol-specific phosphotransferase system IIBC component